MEIHLQNESVGIHLFMATILLRTTCLQEEAFHDLQYISSTTANGRRESSKANSTEWYLLTP